MRSLSALCLLRAVLCPLTSPVLCPPLQVETRHGAVLGQGRMETDPRTGHQVSKHYMSYPKQRLVSWIETTDPLTNPHIFKSCNIVQLITNRTDRTLSSLGHAGTSF